MTPGLINAACLCDHETDMALDSIYKTMGEDSLGNSILDLLRGYAEKTIRR